MVEGGYGPASLVKLMRALRDFLGTNDMMAYVVMMAIRLVELHRVLKPTGSLYLHCDPTASHYIKLILDAVFGPTSFRNEIIWKRASAHNDPNKYGNIHDVIFFYAKTKRYTWNPQYTAYKQKYLDSEWRLLPSGCRYKCENMLDPQNKMAEYNFMGTIARWRTNPSEMMKLWDAPQTEVPNSHGRIKLGKSGAPIKRCRIVFLDERKGVPLQTIWDDIFSLAGGANERLGYPTQKPEALLERIINASSREDDLILDPFCGCGTTISVAERLKRKWIGIDITHLAITLMRVRLDTTFGEYEHSRYEVIGVPADLGSAKALALQDRYQFEWWAISLVGARPARDKKKGADGGVDGYLYFDDDKSGEKKIVVQVKSGKVDVKQIREFRDVINSEEAVIGAFITLEPPKKTMIEAIYTGTPEDYYVYGSGAIKRQFQKIQILTIDGLISGKERLEYPPSAHKTFKHAERKYKEDAPSQTELHDYENDIS